MDLEYKKPLGKINYNLKTRIMIKTWDGSIIFVPSISYILFSLMFTFTGLGIIFISLKLSLEYLSIYTIYYRFLEIAQTKKVFFILFASPFLVLGFFLLYAGFRPIKFMKTRLQYIKGYPWEKIDSAHFSKIQAIQLLMTSVGDADSSNTYEINLVLENKTRLHLFAHHRLNLIRENAEAISKLIKKPVREEI